MDSSVYESLLKSFDVLKLDMKFEELAALAAEIPLDASQLDALEKVFLYLRDKKIRTAIETILKTSRIPYKSPKTFENFDFSVISGDVDRVKSLATLSPIYAHKNLAFIGPPGTGKTHLAQAFGYECCQHRLKTYFIKMTELRDKFTQARATGKVAGTLNSLVRPSCLIIDEIGHCRFDQENTRLFFDMVDRRYNKEGSFNMIFTSNKNPSLWREDFDAKDSLLCALDRVFDDATVYNIKGMSYRGKRLEQVNLRAGVIQNISSEIDSLMN